MGKGDIFKLPLVLKRRRHSLNNILGTSPMVTRLKEEIETIASCDVSVLITGESGTGKELAARAIHCMSPRSARSFVPVNCGAIPESLVENELFGHRKGAFTDASLHQEGVVKEAEAGTLFLDEIGVISSYIQVKLLRLLQDKEYKPLGDPRSRKADIRILAATNHDLKKMIDEDGFREDLYFRLNIVSLYVPPLRERKEDIPLLTEFFLDKYSKEYMKPVKRMTPEAISQLINYSWPGNIRELENKIQHMVVMAPGEEITSRHLDLSPGENTRHSTGFECFKTAKRKAVESFERDYLTRLLTWFNGDLVSAARTAGKSRTAFWNLLSKHQLSPRQFAAVRKG
jgi:DNA-binding NtrC family response regulator